MLDHPDEDVPEEEPEDDEDVQLRRNHLVRAKRTSKRHLVRAKQEPDEEEPEEEEPEEEEPEEEEVQLAKRPRHGFSFIKSM